MFSEFTVDKSGDKRQVAMRRPEGSGSGSQARRYGMNSGAVSGKSAEPGMAANFHDVATGMNSRTSTALVA